MWLTGWSKDATKMQTLSRSWVWVADLLIAHSVCTSWETREIEKCHKRINFKNALGCTFVASRIVRCAASWDWPPLSWAVLPSALFLLPVCWSVVWFGLLWHSGTELLGALSRLSLSRWPLPRSPSSVGSLWLSLGPLSDPVVLCQCPAH